MGLVDEQDDRLGRRLDLVDHLTQALLELALHAGAGLHQSDVERAQGHVAQHRRHVAVDDAAGEALDHRGLADPGLAGEDRVVLTPPQQDVDHLADLGVAADDLVDLALAGAGGEVDGELGQGLALGGGARDGFARRGETLARRGGRGSDLGRAGGDLLELLAQLVDLDLAELGGDVEQGVLQRLGLERAVEQMAGADLAGRELQRGVEPAVLHGFLDQGREIRHRSRAARQLIEGGDHVAGELGVVDLEGGADRAQVVAAVLQQDMDPVDELDVGIAPHLGEAGRRLDRLQRRGVQPSEQRRPANLSHVQAPPS